MSVIVPMETPETCRRCIEMKISVQCRVIKQEPVTAVMAGYNRPKDCPLIELLPHGRLIDADKLKSHLKTSFENKVGGFTYELFFDFMMDILDNAPTILEASKE